MNEAWLLGLFNVTRKDIEELRPVILRVHKAAYLLKLMRIYPFSHYEFETYIDGPYSSRFGRKIENIAPNIDERKLMSLLWFIDHSERWLEVATSILMIKERYADISVDEMLSILQMSKPWLKEKEFKEIYSELEEKIFREINI
jgi:uncharacterized protein YwgA